MSKKWAVFLLMVVFLGACTTLPTGPNVMVLPGMGKPFDQFQVDDMVCRQFAQGQLGTTSEQASVQSTVQGSAIGTVLGAAAGAAIGAAAGNAGVGAAVGAGTGILVGTAAGAESGSTTAGALQWRYDVAYVQCMYAKGNKVPTYGGGRRGSHYSGPAYPPPPQY